MKKALLIVVLMLMAISLLNAETKFKAEMWNRWTYRLIDGDVTKNEFALQRGYFRLEPTFTDKIKGRFNVDFYSSDKTTDTEGAGLKIKYAYLDFKELVPLKNSTFTVGLMKTFFGTIYDWDYTTIEKDPSDMYKFVTSVDYGFGLHGYLPQALGTYALAVYNGEGYKKAGSNINTDMNFVGNLRVTPITGVTLGGSYMKKTVKNAQIDDGSGNMIDNPDREEYSQLAAVGKFAFGPVKVLAQYLQKVKSMPNDNSASDKTTNVISVMPVFKVNNKFDIVTRYDIYDPNTDKDDDKEDTLILGFNYNILRDAKNSPLLFVQTNYQRTSYEDDTKDAVDTFMIQLRWIFSGTIK